MKKPLDTANTNLVSAQGDKVVVLNPKRNYTPAEALEFAAWLIVMAETVSDEIESGSEAETAVFDLTHRLRNL
jgi:predicted nicotinamide N-methyase